jgi:hypothetical protein
MKTLFKYSLHYKMTFQQEYIIEQQTIMNGSHKGFIQIFSSMRNSISTSLNNQALQDNECFT